MSRRRLFTFALGVGLASFSSAQSGVKLHAATAKVGAGVEVRIRWRMTEAWFPAGGMRLYRITGGARQLVKAVSPPQDGTIDTLLDPKFRGRRLATSAAQALPPGNPLSFETPRPPSRASEFVKLRDALDGLRKLKGPVLAAPQAQQRTQLLSIARPRAAGPAAPQVGGGTLAPLASPAANARMARVQLHLASTLGNSRAETIGLGATDRGVSNGATVTYALHAVSATGAEAAQPMATLPNFVVGADPMPLAVDGATFLQDDGEIGLRWNRPTVEVERRSLLISYRISRADSPTGQPRNLTPKPHLIANLPGNVEPVSYFTDSIERPGTYLYRITMVDGFDRVSPPAVVQVVASDWRRPNRPSRAGVSLGRAFVAGVKGSATGKKLLTVSQRAMLRPEATVAWIPGPPAESMPVKFNIYRSDLDQAPPTVLKITQAPIDGTVVIATTESQIETAIGLILGPNYEETHEANLATIRARPAGTPAEVREKAIDVAKAQARYEAQINALKASLRAGNLRSFVDASAQKDRKYAYLISAVYAASGLESDGAQAGRLDFPDPAPPPAVTGLIRKSFTLAPARVAIFSRPPALTSARLFAVGSLKGKKSPPGLPPGRVGIAPGVAQGIARVKRTPLALAAPDYGGTLEIAWTGLAGLRDVRYRIFRRPSEPFTRRIPGARPTVPAAQPAEFVEVGITAPNQVTFQDKVPRSRVRRYDYRVVPLSRWAVSGAPTTLLRVQVPTMIAPEVPNVLSATPGADGEIVVTVEAAPDAQDVHQYALLRGGQRVQTVLASVAAGGVVRLVDSGRKPGELQSYTVIAETAEPVLRSPVSRVVRSAAVKTAVGKPANLLLQATANGVAVSWTAVPGATYIVRRRLGPNGAPTVLAAKVAGGSFTDVFALAGKTYTYEVAAVDPTGLVSPYESKSIAVP